MDKVKNLLGTIAIISLPFVGVFNILEIWTYWPVEFTWTEFFCKVKFTALTMFLISLIMGLLIQAAQRAQTKEA